MGSCPFLSTSLREEECFKECVFYNCEDYGGICPFMNIKEYEMERMEEYESYSILQKEYGFIKNRYNETEVKVV